MGFCQSPEMWVFGCESVCPLQGSKTPKSGKEGLGVKKPHFPPPPQKGRLKSKNPDFALFWGGGKWGFLTPKPFFPDFWVFYPCEGQTDSQVCGCKSGSQRVKTFFYPLLDPFLRGFEKGLAVLGFG